MGDLRNKLAKQEREAATRRMQEALRRKRPPEPPLACTGCQRTVHEVALLALPCERWAPQLYGCEECLRVIGPERLARPRPAAPKAQILCACGEKPKWCSHTADGGRVLYCHGCVPPEVRDMS